MRSDMELACCCRSSTGDKVVAERVETVRQLGFLRAEVGDKAERFLLARQLNPTAFLESL